ncbi:hypothetical protein BU24DRAFT_147557 [Aaosphaeria arxii CBS 175.79]|uniref:Uncharacterized protein n=1 Tax=Aaosphaeria arxii CBS 175.79 TaxID=1450172 RepID=A0A6A5XWS1_9PLEO|nr:uncharacterized protein BU24DRAFT_147557 [Aaosphaeria arxii CBS 175.79]KAF2017287.1 hypothetical protein BU24DRAFT_147557 [Aaosphaeria arxii CBS 175.79]
MLTRTSQQSSTPSHESENGTNPPVSLRAGPSTARPPLMDVDDVQATIEIPKPSRYSKFPESLKFLEAYASNPPSPTEDNQTRQLGPSENEHLTSSNSPEDEQLDPEWVRERIEWIQGRIKILEESIVNSPSSPIQPESFDKSMSNPPLPSHPGKNQDPLAFLDAVSPTLPSPPRRTRSQQVHDGFELLDTDNPDPSSPPPRTRAKRVCMGLEDKTANEPTKQSGAQSKLATTDQVLHERNMSTE